MLKSQTSCKKLVKTIQSSQLIGSGEYGKVYQYKNGKAIKMIDLGQRSLTKSGNMTSHLLFEIHVMKLLNNSKITPHFYDAFLCIDDPNIKYKDQLNFGLPLKDIVSRKAYIVTDQIKDSLTLSEWFHFHPFQFTKKMLFRLLHLIYQMNHKYQIFHCDLHTDNILVKGERFYIIDFGLSWQITEHIFPRLYDVFSLWFHLQDDIKIDKLDIFKSKDQLATLDTYFHEFIQNTDKLYKGLSLELLKTKYKFSKKSI